MQQCRGRRLSIIIWGWSDFTLLPLFFFGIGRSKLLKVAEFGVKLITQVPAKNAVALIGFAHGLYVNWSLSVWRGKITPIFIYLNTDDELVLSAVHPT